MFGERACRDFGKNERNAHFGAARFDPRRRGAIRRRAVQSRIALRARGVCGGMGACPLRLHVPARGGCFGDAGMSDGWE